MEYNIVKNPTMTIIGIERHIIPGPKESFDVHEHWTRFYKEKIMDMIPNKVSTNVFGLYCDYEKYPSPYNFVIGCEVSSIMNIPHGMVAKIIPQSTYAVFHASGEFPKSIHNTWSEIHEANHKGNIKRAFTGDYELYTKTFADADKPVDIFVSIRPK
jgi:predicted transcriptional regulator YdeE